MPGKHAGKQVQLLTKNAERREKFRKLGQWISKQKRNAPTLFNPHYEIKPRTVQDSSVSSKTGPRMLTQQWEATGRTSK